MVFFGVAKGLAVGLIHVPGYRPGFVARNPAFRPRVFDYHVQERRLVRAPVERLWFAINDHDRMARWIECDVFTLIRHGHPDSAGYGAERLLDAMGRKVMQQVTYRSASIMGYRAIAGTPFAYHNGSAHVSAVEGGSEVEWQIRQRTVHRPLGAQVFPQLRQGIAEMLERLAHIVETEAVPD